jgi:hypothetical protein
MRLRAFGRLVVLTSALALASAPGARAQYAGLWPTYGAYMSPGMYGFGYPGASIGFGGWGFPGFGMGAYGFGGFGFGGFGGGLGWGSAIGYPPVAPFAFQPAWLGGYYPGFGPYGAQYAMWNNPASLALGITPLAIQAGLMERGLSTAMPARTTVITPAPNSPGAERPRAATSRASTPSATIPLTPGTYRITVERIDPDGGTTPPADSQSKK